MSRCKFMFLTACLTAIFISPFSSPAADDGGWVTSLGLNLHDPREDKDWKSVTGPEIQLQKWIGKEFGLALTLGRETWDMKSVRKSSGAPGIRFDGEVSGESDFTTFGGSMLWRSPMNKARTVMLNIELGIQLVDADPDATLKLRAIENSSGATRTVRTKLDGDSGTNTRFALDLERVFNNGFELFAGIGYQWNVGKVKIDGDARVFGTSVSAGDIRGSDETSLDAIMARIGVRKRF